MTILSQIESTLPNLSKAESKVAAYILEHPKQTMSRHIGELSKEIGVSEPTVIRFCRTLGLDGYKSFKLSLAQSLPQTSEQLLVDITHNDSPLKIGQKIIDSAIASLQETRKNLDSPQLGKAIEALLRAERIEFYGQGGSGIVASDAQQKFFRLGTPVVAYSDPYIHCVSATLLTPGCAVVAVSHSGSSTDLLHSVKLAMENGATTIAITARQSVLAETADIVLPIDVQEDSTHYAPIKSRMSQLALLDTLAIAIAVAREDEQDLTERLSRSNDALAHKHSQNLSQ